MDLRNFAQKEGGTAKRECPVFASIAKSARCSAETLYMLSLGHKSPSLSLAQRIARATGNVVGLDAWPERKARRRKKAKAA
jgi:hypothetical protein